MNPNQPTPEQQAVFDTFRDCVRTAVESVPRSYIDLEGEKAWNDITARMIVELSKAGMIQVDPQPAKIVKPNPKPRGPKRCETVMPGAGQCILNTGHRGQHQLDTGNRWG